MKLYRVISETSAEPCQSRRCVSNGYSTRAAAERFAASLAAAGKCALASIESYEDENEDEDEA